MPNQCPNFVVCEGFIDEETAAWINNPTVCRVCHQCFDNGPYDMIEFNNGSELIYINEMEEECKMCIHESGISQNQLFLILQNTDLYEFRCIIYKYLFGFKGVKLPQCEHVYCRSCFKIKFIFDWRDDSLYPIKPEFPFPEYSDIYYDNYDDLERDQNTFRIDHLVNLPEWLNSPEMIEYERVDNRYWTEVAEIEERIDLQVKEDTKCIECFREFIKY